MTIDEMHLRYKLGLDKVDSLQLPDILPEEIDVILNIAIKQFVRTRYGTTNIYKEGFEGTEKRRADLRTLVTTTVLTPNEIAQGLTKYTVNFPTDFWFLVRERVALSGVFCKGDNDADDSTPTLEYPYTKGCKLDNLETELDDPFARPSNAKVLVTYENNLYTIYTNGKTVVNTEISYVRKPAYINSLSNPQVQCDLPEHTHEEIVEYAISWSLETIESGRFATQFEKIKTIE